MRSLARRARSKHTSQKNMGVAGGGVHPQQRDVKTPHGSNLAATTSSTEPRHKRVGPTDELIHREKTHTQHNTRHHDEQEQKSTTTKSCRTQLLNQLLLPVYHSSLELDLYIALKLYFRKFKVPCAVFTPPPFSHLRTDDDVNSDDNAA